MSSIVRFDTALTPGFVLFEVEDVDQHGRRKVSAGSETVETASQTLEEAIESVKPLIENLKKVIGSLVDEPTEVSLKFGIKLTGKVGAIIASSSVEGACEITVKWGK